MRFKDKVVLITGASGGIGRGLVEAFASDGASVAAVYNRNEVNFPEKVLKLKANLINPEEAQNVVAKCLDALGNIDILINGAAISSNNFVEKTTIEDWRSVMDANLTTAFNVTKYLLPSMKERRTGRIINISSIVGEIGAIGCSSYVASKAALVGFTKALAKETVKYNIFVNAVLLGYFEAGLGLQFSPKLKQKITEMIPMERFGNPEDVTKAIFFLSESEYMTGSAIRLSGGL